MKLQLITFVIVSMTTAIPLYAQDTEPDSIEARLAACDKFTDPEERLACFNAVAGSLKKTAPETAAPPPVQAPVAPAAEAGIAAIPAAAAVGEQTPGPAATGESPSSEADDFGSDSMEVSQKQKEEKREESLDAVIVSVQQHYDRRFSVELDNGQVWRETEGSRVGAPKVGRAVQIETGSIGGYRMKIDGIPRVAWVRRTK